jgi:hypothetical protein
VPACLPTFLSSFFLLITSLYASMPPPLLQSPLHSSKLLYTSSHSLHSPLHRAHPPLHYIRIPSPWGQCVTRFWVPRPGHGSHESCERLRYVLYSTMSFLSSSPIFISFSTSSCTFFSSTPPPLLSLYPLSPPPSCSPLRPLIYPHPIPLTLSSLFFPLLSLILFCDRRHPACGLWHIRELPYHCLF